MKIQIRASGSLKSPALKDLCSYYQKRLILPLEILEVPATPSKKTTTSFLDHRSSDARTYLLDETGENLTSLEWAQLIEQGQLQGLKYIYFLIGDSHGFDASTRQQCPLRLSFGAQTWPHDLVRLLLLEQLYRSQQILSNHPYHKKG